ncbi:hypothetical protein ACFX1T_008295 [Malus domestica]
MLTYKIVQDLELKGHANSDFAGCVDDRKSTSGYIFFLTGATISWRSTKKRALATSNMEAEFIALFEATKTGLWLKNLISFMRIVDTISRPLTVYLKEHVKKGEIFVEHIDTKLMLADPFTKPLVLGVFKEHVSSMGMHDNLGFAEVWE